MKKSLGARTMPMPAPVWVVGTYDREGRPNVMTAAWAGICCSRPPCVAVSLQKVRYTYDAIVARQAFTINVPSQAHVKAADYFGLASGRREDKLARAGLTAVASELVDAPYVAEFPVVMECRLRHTVELGSHTQFIGEVVDVKIDEELLAPDGHPDVARLGLFVYVEGYWAVGERLAEAFSIGKEMQG